MISNSNRKQLASEALKASAALRKKLGYDLSSPVNIYDLCERSLVPVRFVEINMEGMYIHLGEGVKPTIFISVLRPFHRKVYTCAHEFGHHHFGHGMNVDDISTSDGSYTNEEFLADTFASFLLMPPVGLKGAFIKRRLTFENITSIDCFLVACSFGVGYSTLVKHLLSNSYIEKTKADFLLRKSVKSIKQDIVGEDITTSLYVIDKHFSGKTIDVETSSYIVLPNDVVVEDEGSVEKIKNVFNGTLYKCLRPGITRVYALSVDWSCFMRIQKFQYVGLSRYRHLSD